jgi:hypothetical protein
VVDRNDLIAYLGKIDAALERPAMLYIYGSAACILLGEPERSSLDIDVVGPYSNANYAVLAAAAGKAGIPVNPEVDSSSDHIEWIQALRLCLPKPLPEHSILLWQGDNLTVQTAPPAELIASKLIRYDALDQGDIQFLLAQSPISMDDVDAAVRRLPSPFHTDAKVLENLANLRRDVAMWRGDRV